MTTSPFARSAPRADPLTVGQQNPRLQRIREPNVKHRASVRSMDRSRSTTVTDGTAGHWDRARWLPFATFRFFARTTPAVSAQATRMSPQIRGVTAQSVAAASVPSCNSAAREGRGSTVLTDMSEPSQSVRTSAAAGGERRVAPPQLLVRSCGEMGSTSPRHEKGRRFESRQSSAALPCTV
jgi:hypothetical protein